jgi:hypothetical protein
MSEAPVDSYPVNTPAMDDVPDVESVDSASEYSTEESGTEQSNSVDDDSFTSGEGSSTDASSMTDSQDDSDDMYLPLVLTKLLSTNGGRSITDVMQDIHATLVEIATALKSRTP